VADFGQSMPYHHGTVAGHKAKFGFTLIIDTNSRGLVEMIFSSCNDQWHNGTYCLGSHVDWFHAIARTIAEYFNSYNHFYPTTFCC
jgi:hypothetical protein